jgi:sensory rhodopsin
MIGTWFTLGTIGMFVGTAILAYGFRLVPAERRKRYAVLVSIPGIAIFAYALMALGIGGIEVGGQTVWAPRYVDWLLTTPLNVLFLGLFAGADRETIGQLVGLQTLTIVFGMAGALTDGLIAWGLFALGAASFAGVGYLLYGAISDAARGSLSEVGFGLYETLRNFVVVLWGIYPIIWILGQTGVGLMDLETTTMVVAYLDVVTKVGFGLLALSGEVTIEQLDTDAVVDAQGESVTEPDPQPSD